MEGSEGSGEADSPLIKEPHTGLNPRIKGSIPGIMT